MNPFVLGLRKYCNLKRQKKHYVITMQEQKRNNISYNIHVKIKFVNLNNSSHFHQSVNFLIIGQKLVSRYFLFFSLCSKENKWTHVIKWNVQDKNVEKRILRRQKKEKAKYMYKTPITLES